MKATSAKYNARLLAHLLKKHGCQHIVVAPGSRNAPLIMALSADDAYTTYSVPDERAAAFTALGMALENRQPAAVICTSGSAAANFLPAVTEAYYQQVPLIIITADRPEEWIGEGIGQTIQQKHIFGHHILAEAHLHREPQDNLAENYNQRLVNKTLEAAYPGPVHINVPFSEPLYDKIDVPNDDFRFIKKIRPAAYLPQNDLAFLAKEWNSSKKIWVLCGQMTSNPALWESLAELQKKSPFLLLTETLSNAKNANRISTIDRLINTLSPSELEQLAPDLVITLGGEMVSKMVKTYLQSHPPKHHWHVSTYHFPKDSFLQLNQILPVQAAHFFRQIEPLVHTQKEHNWPGQWHLLNQQKERLHLEFLKSAPFTDLTAFAVIEAFMPKDGILHCANSASIRYAQLFEHPQQRKHFANRGTSGIDGSTATAIGHALLTKSQVTLVTGDVAFLYDSGAFWNDRLPKNLKIIVLNNNGGNIFRIIKGPAEIEDFERFQETQHQHKLEGIGITFGLPWLKADDLTSLKVALKQLYKKDELQVLEVKTPRLKSPEILADYFKYLKAN